MVPIFHSRHSKKIGHNIIDTQNDGLAAEREHVVERLVEVVANLLDLQLLLQQILLNLSKEENV